MAYTGNYLVSDIHYKITSLMREARGIYRHVRNEPEQAEAHFKKLQSFLISIIFSQNAIESGGSKSDQLSCSKYNWDLLLEVAGMSNAEIKSFLTEVSICQTVSEFANRFTSFPQNIASFLDGLETYTSLLNTTMPYSFEIARIDSLSTCRECLRGYIDRSGFPLHFLDPRDPTDQSLLVRLKAIEIAIILGHINGVNVFLLGDEPVSKSAISNVWGTAKEKILPLIQNLKKTIQGYDASDHRINYGLRVFAEIAERIVRTGNCDDLMTHLLGILYGNYKIGDCIINFRSDLPGQNVKEVVAFNFAGDFRKATYFHDLLSYSSLMRDSRKLGPSSLVRVFTGPSGGEEGHDLVYVELDGNISRACVKALIKIAAENYELFLRN